MRQHYYCNRALAYQRKGQLDLAISDLNKAMAIAENPREVFYFRSPEDLAYVDKSYRVHVISDYTTAIEIDPRFAYAYIERGLAYQSIGEYDRAFSEFNKVIKRSSSPSWAHRNAYYNRGVTYAKMSQFDMAISDFNMAISHLMGDGANFYNARGRLFKDIGETKKACIDFKRACELLYCDDYNRAKSEGFCE